MTSIEKRLNNLEITFALQSAVLRRILPAELDYELVKLMEEYMESLHELDPDINLRRGLIT